MAEKRIVKYEDHLDEIRKLYKDITSYLRLTIDKASRIGELLIQQRKDSKHGSFLAWVETNLPFDIKTAERYMNVNRYYEQLKIDNVSNLNQAYTKLSTYQWKDKHKEKAKGLGLTESEYDQKIEKENEPSS